MSNIAASNFATGGNVEETKFARNLKKYRPLVWALVGVGLAVLFIFCLTQGLSGLAALQNVHPGVTSTATSLISKAAAYPLSSGLSNGTMMLGLAATVLTLPVSIILLSRRSWARFRILPSLLGFFSASPLIIVVLLIPSPNQGLVGKVDAWGAKQLHVSDLSQYVPVKAGTAQGFTVTNDSGDKVTFEIKTILGDTYDTTTYRVLEG